MELRAVSTALVQKVKYTIEYAYEKIPADNNENVQKRQSESV